MGEEVERGRGGWEGRGGEEGGRGGGGWEEGRGEGGEREEEGRGLAMQRKDSCRACLYCIRKFGENQI